MMGSINCVYETPCGWCSKWDKKCDRKAPERGKRANVKVFNDAMNIAEISSTLEVVQKCVSGSDHEWECCGVSTKGIDYRCKKCGTHKTEQYKTTNSGDIYGG